MKQRPHTYESVVKTKDELSVVRLPVSTYILAAELRSRALYYCASVVTPLVLIVS